MEKKGSRATSTGNRLLDLLSASDRKRILPQLKLEKFFPKDSLFNVGENLQSVWFPVSCTLSLTVPIRSAGEVEVATEGYEGMAGLHLFLTKNSAPIRGFCQIEGEVLAWNIKSFLRECRMNKRLDEILKCYSQHRLSSYAQTVACNRTHTTEQRFARWMLASHDRASSDEFALTHEFMAKMLGVRRATVSEVAAKTQKKGLITYRWGKIRIVDRKGLENASCECYEIDLKSYESLLGSL